MSESEIRFCIRCGKPLSKKLLFARERPFCPACGWVYFADPKVAVAALVIGDGQVLLTRRINEPRRGFWSFPAGFMDAGEDPAEAARRECREETGLELDITALWDIVFGREHERGADILILYRAKVIGGTLTAGDDADQAEFFELDQLPPLAFVSTQKILRPFLSQ